jgi:hypothetical protein
LKTRVREDLQDTDAALKEDKLRYTDAKEILKGVIHNNTQKEIAKPKLEAIRKAFERKEVENEEDSWSDTCLVTGSKLPDGVWER